LSAVWQASRAATAMDRLKSETRELHAATELTPLAQAMVRGCMTRAHYELQLDAYLTIHSALENCLQASRDARVVSVYDTDMDKVPLLSRDLVALRGGQPQAAADAKFSTAVFEAKERVRANSVQGCRLLGMLYVMEGSTLGAAFLLPRLRETMKLRTEESSYYEGYGKSARKHWSQFSDRMNAALDDEASQDGAVDAARTIFSCLGDIFDAISAIASNQVRVA
jgi:heme oxygenase